MLILKKSCQSWKTSYRINKIYKIYLIWIRR